MVTVVNWQTIRLHHLYFCWGVGQLETWTL